MFEDTHILITGANGFVGHHLTKALLATGARVSQVVRAMTPGGHKDGAQVVLDLADRVKVVDVFSSLQPNYVIHLAGSKDRVNNVAQFRDTYDKNLLISLNIIDACLTIENFKRLIFLGTCDEYGQVSTPFDETQREMPSNAYGLSKLAITQVLSGLFLNLRFPSVVLRPTVIYGPTQGDEMFLSALIQSLLAKKEFPMTLGEQSRDLVHVDDVVDAIIKAIKAGERVNGAVINIGAGVSYQIKHIAAMVAKLIHPDASEYLELGSVQYRSNEIMDYSVKIARAKELLGWLPSTNLECGLQQTIEHFKTAVDGRKKRIQGCA